MAALPPRASPTVEAILCAYEADTGEGFREHLGASLIGGPCDRALWYIFRWITPAAHGGRMQRLFETGRLEEERLIRNLRRIGVTVLEVDPDSGLTWANLGFALQSAGQPDAALQAYRQALALDPDRAEVYLNTGVLLLGRGRHDEALAQVDQALARGASGASPHYARYRILLARGERVAAIASLETALAAEPKRPDLMNDLAWHLATEADPELRDAARSLRLAYKANQRTGGQEPAILDTLAAALSAAGRHEEALQAVEAAIAAARARGDDAGAAQMREHRARIRERASS